MDLATDWSPTLVLLDIDMLDVNGSPTLNDLREMPEMASTPVIVVAPEERFDDVDKLYDGDCTGYLFRPFEVEDVLNILTDTIQDQISVE